MYSRGGIIASKGMRNWRNQLSKGIHLWALLGVALLPFPFYLFGFQQYIAPFLFGRTVAALMGPASDGQSGVPDFTSDAPALYWLLVILGIASMVLVVLIGKVRSLRSCRVSLIATCRVVCCYYLSLQLLKYGFDKVFKAQFYLPEPNILYTPLGQLDKDILFWSTMGTSWSYNVLMGLMEIIPAVLLLFRRTRIIGLFLTAGVLVQVVMINFSFGITVKLFSTFLLLLTVLLLSPVSGRLYSFFVGQKNVALPVGLWDLPFLKPVFMKAAVKSFVVGILLLEALYPYLKYRNFNDDLAPRPEMHGAYKVVSMADMNGDTLSQPFPVKRFFIHRQNYLIFQDQADRMRDYKLSVKKESGMLELTDYNLQTMLLPYHFYPKDSLLELQYKGYLINGKVLNWNELPALK